MGIQASASKEDIRVDDANIPGPIIKLGRLYYVLAPVPLVRMHKLETVLKGGDFTTDGAYAEAVVDGVHYGLVRNYPDLPRDVVSDNLDMTNFRDVLDGFMVANGLQKKDEAEGEVGGS